MVPADKFPVRQPVRILRRTDRFGVVIQKHGSNRVTPIGQPGDQHPRNFVFDGQGEDTKVEEFVMKGVQRDAVPLCGKTTRHMLENMRGFQARRGMTHPKIPTRDRTAVFVGGQNLHAKLRVALGTLFFAAFRNFPLKLQNAQI